jgi:hypothetical protein
MRSPGAAFGDLRIAAADEGRKLHGTMPNVERLVAMHSQC